MSWRDGFHQAVKAYLENRNWQPVAGIDRIIDIEYDEPGDTYCPTCGPDSHCVYVTYIDTNGKEQFAHEYISLWEFLQSLPD